MTAPPSIPDFQGSESAARIEALMEMTIQLLELEDLELLGRVLNQEHPADLADLARRLDDNDLEVVFGLLQEHLAADVLAETDIPTTLAIADDLDPQELSDLVEEMDPDDAADVLSELEEEEAEEILGLMEDEDAEEVQELMAHEEDTGGGIMTPDLVMAHVDSTVSDVIEALRKEAEDSDILDLYFVNGQNQLQGIVPVHRMVTARPQMRMSELMNREIISVSPETDQEDIAQVFTRYNLLAVPVVDANGELVGQITVDDVIDVIQEEATEDIYKMAGTSDEEMERTSVFGVYRTRLPWLLIALFGSLLSGVVIDMFDATLKQTIALAAFIPIIMAMGGSSGLQSCTVTVRGLVTGHVIPGLIMRTVLREIGTAAAIGLTCGVAAGVIAWFWFDEPTLGVCVGTSMFLVISIAVLLGVLAPLIFDRIGIDPAVASGPFITTTNDIIGLTIYLGLATYMVQRFMSG
jgi:magnesium transporter